MSREEAQRLFREVLLTHSGLSDKDSYTAPEVAKLLGVSKRTVYRLVKQGHLLAPLMRSGLTGGTSLRFFKELLIDFILNRLNSGEEMAELNEFVVSEGAASDPRVD